MMGLRNSTMIKFLTLHHTLMMFRSLWTRSSRNWLCFLRGFESQCAKAVLLLFSGAIWFCLWDIAHSVLFTPNVEARYRKWLPN